LWAGGGGGKRKSLGGRVGATSIQPKTIHQVKPNDNHQFLQMVLLSLSLSFSLTDALMPEP